MRTFAITVCALVLLIAPARGANVLINSGAEASIRRIHGWAQQDYFGNPSRSVDWITAAEAHTGTHAFQMNYGYLYLGLFRLEAGSYVCSYVWKDNGTISTAYAGVNGFYGSNVRGYTNNPTTSWTTNSFTFTASSTGMYKLAFETYGSSPGARLYIDSIMIETGSTPSPWEPTSDFEVGLSSQQPQNVYFSADTPEIDLTWWNSTGGDLTKIVEYQVITEFNVEVASGYITNTVAANSSETTQFTLPIKGWQRVVTRVLGVEDSRDEITATVLQFPRSTGPNLTSVLGTHLNWSILSVTNAINMRFGTFRAFWNWDDLETSSNVFNYNLPETKKGFEAAFAVWTNQPIDRLMALGPFQSDSADMTWVPDWALIPVADHGGDLNIPVATNFFSKVTLHKTGITNIWEIINEPEQSQGDWFEQATNYANLVNQVVPQIKAVDPTSLIVVMGGSLTVAYAQAVWTNLTAGVQSQVDAVSCHRYPPDNTEDQDMNSPTAGSIFDPNVPAWCAYFLPLGVEVWNTESGSWSRFHYRTEDGLWSYDLNYQATLGEYERAEECIRSAILVERVMKQAGRCLGYGMAKYFYYDGRQTGADMWPANNTDTDVSHCTTTDMFDESLKPQGAALAVMNGFIPDITAFGRTIPANPTTTTNVECYLFDTGTTNVALIWNMDRIIRTLTLTNTDFALYDVMGRPLETSSSLRIFRMPQYLVTDTMTMAQLSNTIKYATMATNANTTAPYLTIDIAPTSEWAGGLTLIKWSANSIRWYNDSQNRTNIVFRWKLNEDAYTAYSQTNGLYVDIAAGNHTLYVEAIDREGNSSVESFAFDPEFPDPPREPDMRFNEIYIER